MPVLSKASFGQVFFAFFHDILPKLVKMPLRSYSPALWVLFRLFDWIAEPMLYRVRIFLSYEVSVLVQLGRQNAVLNKVFESWSEVHTSPSPIVHLNCLFNLPQIIRVKFKDIINILIKIYQHEQLEKEDRKVHNFSWSQAGPRCFFRSFPRC